MVDPAKLTGASVCSSCNIPLYDAAVEVVTAWSICAQTRVGFTSRKVHGTPGVRNLFPKGSELISLPFFRQTIDAVVGWGRKGSGITAQRYATRHGLPLYTMEDGFVRSLGLGVAGNQPLGLVPEFAVHRHTVKIAAISVT
jgi:hypothetical protein